MILNILFMLLFSYISALSCKDETGINIPTWTIMKLPHGTNYYYFDENNGYTFSPNSLNDTSTGALTYTMNQLWDPSIQYMLYNDEPPRQTTYNFSVAHSKAVWMWDNINAIIITHSIPKFPEGPHTQKTYNGLMSNAWDYGQSASCFQISLNDLPQIFNLIDKTIPLIYERTCTECYNTSLSTTIDNTNICMTYMLNNSQILFIKPINHKGDIWASCIGSYFSSNISVESWIHGTMDGPYCPPTYNFQTLDIQSLQFPEGQTFKEYDDHSKWGILESPFVCFGDLNRVTSQMTRSGTVYCWKDKQLWTQLKLLIKSTNSC